MKKILFAILYCLRVTKFAAWWHRKRVVFLCYHGVTKQDRSPEDPKGLHVNHLRFAAQLDFLQRHYNIVSLQDYLIAHNGGQQLGNYSVVLTFDDGFRNFLTVAAPLLSARKLPAIVFLITNNAGEENGYRTSSWTPDDDRRYLSWSEARNLKENHGFEFGSHTCSHSRLLGLSAGDTERELLQSFNDLVNNLAVSRPTLSYPKGEYSRLLATDAHKLGYSCAVTTDRGLNETDHDLFTLGRTLIGDNDDEASFAVRVSGLRWWLVKMLRGAGRQDPVQPRPTEESLPAGEPGFQLMD